MLRLLLVDDETATRNGLIEHIDWAALGIGDVAGAKDGLEGLALAKAFRPDILISDVRMPRMDGIALVAELQSILPQCRVIFLSGYSDKAYLKAAIRFGAVSYVEKPIDLDELTEAVARAAKQCLFERGGAAQSQMSDDELIQAALRGESEALAALPFRLSSGGHEGYVVLLLQSSHKREQAPRVLTAMRQSLRRYTRVCGLCGDVYAAIVAGLPPDHVRREALALLSGAVDACGGGMKFFCAAGEHRRSLADMADELGGAFESAAIALKRLFTLGYGHIAVFEPRLVSPPEPRPCDENAFLQLVQQANVDGVRDLVDALCADAMAGAREGQIKDAFMKLCFALTREAERRGIRPESDGQENDHFFWGTITNAPTLDSLRELFLAHVARFVRMFEEGDANNRSIAQVLKDIHERYADPSLSVKQLAERAYLTPTYLSFLFKKVTGQTMTEYIARHRIEQAKALLTAHHKLTEVAHQVGYSDASYFSKAFKQHTGMTPSKYRESQQS